MTFLRTLVSTAVVAVSAVAACAPPAAAGQDDIWKSDNAVSLDLGAAYLNYAETLSGATLDTERGWLPTVRVGLGLLANDDAPIPGLYLHANAGMNRGYTSYNGALCNELGQCEPYQATTDDRIYGGAFQAGRGFAIGDPLMVIPFLEIGYRYWERHLEGVGGYIEDYQNWSGMGGLLVQFSPRERWVASLSAAGGATFAASMTAPEPPAAATFTLGSKAAWRVEAKIGYRFTEHLELTGTADFDDFGYGASPVNAAGFFEPNSTTQQTTLLMGISYHFF